MHIKRIINVEYGTTAPSYPFNPRERAASMCTSTKEWVCTVTYDFEINLRRQVLSVDVYNITI